MDAVLSGLICFFLALVGFTSAVPPDICFSQFKWQDCGMPPKAVLYYYKSGSRCEVGIWRGCLPNPNMFVDEYECVQTCIFSVRAKAHNYHSFQENLIDDNAETDAPNSAEMSTTNTISTNDGENGTDTTNGGSDADATGSGSDTNKEGGSDTNKEGDTDSNKEGNAESNKEGETNKEGDDTNKEGNDDANADEEKPDE